MQTRIVQMGAAIAAVVFAFTVARTDAFAASDKESCSTTSTDVSPTNADGTEAICDAATGPPNKATAHASELGVADSLAEDGAKAVSSASGEGAGASATAVSEGNAAATASGKDALSSAEAEDGAITKATASGADSEALALIGVTGGGKATSTATAGGFANAEMTSAGGGDAVATAHDSRAEADSEIKGGGGKANSLSTGADSIADAEAKDGGVAKATASEGALANTGANAAGCKATANGSGAGGEAEAFCDNARSVVTAHATKGSIARGSDSTAPTCTPMNGGIAKVRSPKGNCG